MTTHSSFSSRNIPQIRVRPFEEADRAFVLSLAPRLVIGIPPWRDPEKMLLTVQEWLVGSLENHGGKTMVFVAEGEQGEGLGFAICFPCPPLYGRWAGVYRRACRQ